MLRSISILLLITLATTKVVAEESIELLKTITIPGKQRDRSELVEELSPGMPHNLFGGISALEYLGNDDLYLALPDRGPLDGAVDWNCRVHLVRISIQRDSSPGYSILRTVILRDGDRVFSGHHSRFESTDEKMWRLDPEGIRLRNSRRFVISDEYGPHLLEFDLNGMLQRQVPMPEHFKVAVPCMTKAQENETNQIGRQGNRGIEGLAISGNKQKLFGLFQSPLLQDCKRTANGKLVGTNCRLVEYRLTDGIQYEYVYQLDHPSYKLNEILAINDHQFLVIERDGESGVNSRFKRIIKIDLSSATALKNEQSLTLGRLPEGIQPVEKQPFIDLLDKRFGLAGDSMPEKIESLAFGPTLDDGRRTLVIVSDNDFHLQQPTYIYCFALGKSHEHSQETTTR